MLVCLVAFSAGLMKADERANGLALPGQQSGKEETVTFKDLNYQFKQPAKPWVRMDVAKVNKHASFGLMRTRPQIFLSSSQRAQGSIWI